MKNKNLPDVALETKPQMFAPLNWVGMGDIEVPIVLSRADGAFRLAARVEAKVSLDKQSARGIHMSRLYLSAQQGLSSNPISLSLLGNISDEFLKTHKDLSTQALISVRFELPVLRSALKSANKSWRLYPVVLSVVNVEGKKQFFAESTITYSSTCPASAALARQLIQENFSKNFEGRELNFAEISTWLGSTQGILATPHAQRSGARVKVEVTSQFEFDDLLDLIEDSLQTAVQGAVKREDEQEFALRNGQNLMFCEDAARRVKTLLDQQGDILDYLAEFTHSESLHPHNAVSQVSKGKTLTQF